MKPTKGSDVTQEGEAVKRMKTIKTISLLLFLSLWAVGVNAQRVGPGPLLNENYQNTWSIGAGLNIVNDSGYTFANPSENLNFSVPFYVSAEYYLNNQFSFMAMLSSNKYKEGKVYNKGYIVGDEVNYFSADLNTKFSFREILNSYQFDPYVFLGFGYTSLSEFTTVQKEYPFNVIEHTATGRLTINAGLGFNVWITQNWGVNLNIAGKWGANTAVDKNNHKQYSLGAVYILN